MSSKITSKTKTETHKTAAATGGFVSTKSTVDKRRKHVVLSQPRLKQAQAVLGTKTESEAIEIALERVIDEARRDKQAWAAHENFARNMIERGAEIEDVFGRLKGR